MKLFKQKLYPKLYVTGVLAAFTLLTACKATGGGGGGC